MFQMDTPTTSRSNNIFILTDPDKLENNLYMIGLNPTLMDEFIPTLIDVIPQVKFLYYGYHYPNAEEVLEHIKLLFGNQRIRDTNGEWSEWYQLSNNELLFTLNHFHNH